MSASSSHLSSTTLLVAAACGLQLLLVPAEGLAPNFFAVGDKNLPSIGRRSGPPSTGARASNPSEGSRELQDEQLRALARATHEGQFETSDPTVAGVQARAVEMARLEENMRALYTRLHEASASGGRRSQDNSCLGRHEAAEILKLLQAATRK